MLKQYFTQAWFSIKANPLVSIISIAGTALSIAMIMVVVLVYQIQIAPYPPEVNRDRSLYITGLRASNGKSNNGTAMSHESFRECIASLKIPETSTAYCSERKPLSPPSKRLFKEYTIKYTDTNFWKIFHFDFLSGKPFTESDFDSGIRRIVITESVAKEIFGAKDVLGRTVIMDFEEYIICGVVKDVTRAAQDAYGNAWVPYSCNPGIMRGNYCEGIGGVLLACIMAKKSSDFGAIHEELNQQVKRYNDSKVDYQLIRLNPISQLDKAMGANSFWDVDKKEFYLQLLFLVLFLLIVPALNLIGVFQSSVQQRNEEVGLRKTFGGTYDRIIMQFLSENMVLTFIGGGIGLVLSFTFLWIGKSFLVAGNPELTWQMLFKPFLFIVAFIFVLLLNFLSSFFPAWKISRKPIVESLNS